MCFFRVLKRDRNGPGACGWDNVRLDRRGFLFIFSGYVRCGGGIITISMGGMVRCCRPGANYFVIPLEYFFDEGRAVVSVIVTAVPSEGLCEVPVLAKNTEIEFLVG